MQNSVKLILMLVLVIGLVGTNIVSAKQMSSESTIEGFVIETPPTIYVTKQNEAFRFHTHVVNLSTGYPVISPEASCVLHLYNESGSHILNTVMDWDNEGEGVGDFVYVIPANNFTNTGIYSYIVNCNDSRIGGFIASAFEVNPTGITLNIKDSIPNGIVIVLFFGMSIFFLVFARTTEEGGVKLFFNVIGYLMLIFTVGGSYILLQATQTGLEGITKGMLFTIAIVFIVIMYYIFINLTRTSIAMFNAKKGFGDIDNSSTF